MSEMTERELLKECREVLLGTHSNTNNPYCKWCMLAAKIDALLATPDEVRVPREPTEAMIKAYKGAIRKAIEANPDLPRRRTKRGYQLDEREKILCRYKAMLLAAAEGES